MSKISTPRSIVVYADDDADDRQLVREAFAELSENVEVVTLQNGGEALRYLEQKQNSVPTPCLIILDVNMPVADGKQVLRRLRTMETYSEVPVVLFTTSSLPADRSFAERYRAGFITKPLHYRQMKQITEEFIGHCAEEVRRKLRNE